MKLAEARTIAGAFVEKVRSQCHRVEVAGSIRRGKAEVRDIDIVCIPKDARVFLCGMPARQRGDKIIRLDYAGAPIDIYLATEGTFEVLRLIRTGSAAHNVKLASAAKRHGWTLSFDKGLTIGEGKTITTEAGILDALLGRVPEPSERE